MPPEKKDAAYLFDIMQAAEKVQRYIKGKTSKDFFEDDLLRDGVERNLEIIGEAARRISAAFKQEHPDIPWRQIIAQRNVLIHEYNDIETKEIWEVATIHIPRLITLVKPFIPPVPPEADEKP